MATRAIGRPGVTAWIVILIFGAVLFNYVDRGAIAIAAPLLKPELGLSATQFGLAVSAFFWVYAPLQLGIGWAMDRWCVYRLLAAGVALWALSTFLTGFVGGLPGLDDWEKFDVPGLRGISRTAPYFINNSAATLEEMLDHYDALFRRAEVNFVPGPTAVVPPIATTDGVHFDRRPLPEERAALLAYLKKL